MSKKTQNMITQKYDVYVNFSVEGRPCELRPSPEYIANNMNKIYLALKENRGSNLKKSLVMCIEDDDITKSARVRIDFYGNEEEISEDVKHIENNFGLKLKQISECRQR